MQNPPITPHFIQNKVQNPHNSLLKEYKDLSEIFGLAPSQFTNDFCYAYQTVQPYGVSFILPIK